MEPMRLKFFLKTPSGEMRPSDLTVGIPVRFLGLPGGPVSSEGPPIYQASASFPGVLPDEGMSNRDTSSLVALIGLLNSVEQFCIDFEKAGGTFYFAMPDDETKPFLGEPVKARRFFRT